MVQIWWRLERQRRNGRPGTHPSCSTSQPAQSRLEPVIIFLIYPYQDGCNILQTPTQQKERHNELNFINQMETAVLATSQRIREIPPSLL